MTLMHLQTACFADIGGRSEQQDRAEVLARGDVRLLVLADGMGGHEGGAQAAQTVIDTARELFFGEPRPEDSAGSPGPQRNRGRASPALRARKLQPNCWPASSTAPTNECVPPAPSAASAPTAPASCSISPAQRQPGPMSATAACIVSRTVVSPNAPLITPSSNSCASKARITEEEMKTHPDQNRLYGALGGKETPEIDTGGKDHSERDGFLLASDGLWENVSEGQMEAVFQAGNLEEALKTLVQQASSRGGPGCDNISAAAARHRKLDRVGKTVPEALPDIAQHFPVHDQIAAAKSRKLQSGT